MKKFKIVSLIYEPGGKITWGDIIGEDVEFYTEEEAEVQMEYISKKYVGRRDSGTRFTILPMWEF